MKKKVAGCLVLAMALMFASFAGSISVFAHGYVSYPESRVYLANQGINKNVGAAQYEPQSIEAPKGFPEGGPADGKIAGGGKYPALDEQSADRWVKVDVPTGNVDFTWTLTAPHRTSGWKYYITKKGWDPNAPLSRAQLELLTYIPADGSMPQKQVTQTITIPDDREGYYIILGIWDIADTANAFYQVIDANIVNGKIDPDIEAPTQPQQVTAAKVTAHSVNLKWLASTDNQGVKNYEVLRDGKALGTTSELQYEDTTVTAGASYVYTVRAIDKAGNKSIASKALTVNIPDVDPSDTEKPSVPSGISVHHATESEIMLHWQPSTDNIGVSGYNIYRNGMKVGTSSTTMYTDKHLQAGTSYSYTIAAFDYAGNVSDLSTVFVATTKTAAIPVPVPVPDDGSWRADKIYTAGMTATYNGRTYKAKWWTKGNNPETSDVWQFVSGITPQWNAKKAYNSGDKVTYNGKIYQAKWWTYNQNPETNSVWVLVTE